MRDGRVTQILDGEHLTEDAIAQQLVLGAGFEREADVRKRLRGMRSAPTSFRVSGWSQVAGTFSNVDMSIDCGEIVGLLGVEGSGARELLRSFAGLEDCYGRIEIGAVPSTRCIVSPPMSRRRARRACTPICPSARTWSSASASPRSQALGFFLMVRRMRRFAKDAVVAIPWSRRRRRPSRFRSLSGGNQQKVAIAQALVRQPKLLTLEEPTRGVDIGSKAEIYRILRQFVHAGNAVVMFCTEVLEVFEAVDRVHVVSDGILSNPCSSTTIMKSRPLPAT